MTAAELIRIIGVSHLLQPPLTLLLSSPRGIDLRAQLVPTTPLAAEVLTNMAVASVLLPTALGMLLALYPALALEPGPPAPSGRWFRLFGAGGFTVNSSRSGRSGRALPREIGG